MLAATLLDAAAAISSRAGSASLNGLARGAVEVCLREVEYMLSHQDAERSLLFVDLEPVHIPIRRYLGPLLLEEYSLAYRGGTNDDNASINV